MDMPAVLDRIDAIKNRLNLSDRKLSLMAELSGDAIRNWRRRVSAGEEDAGANRRSVDAVARALGVSPHWLLTGEGRAEAALLASASETMDGAPDGQARWRIPCYDIEGALGGESVIGIEEALFDIEFSTRMLRDITHTPPDKLALVRLKGHSMVPTLMSGDWILVDTTRRTAGLGGIFLLRSEDMLMVKRVIPIEGRRIRLMSDNPSVPSFDADADTETIRIVGRAVWVGRSI